MKKPDPPKDRRFLALCEQRHYDRRRGWYVAGYAWKEVWWGPVMCERGKFEYRMWCGTDKTFSTDKPHFTEWAELPGKTFVSKDL